MRQKLSSNDEAKFALLEPDGVSPMRHRQRATAQATATQRKGCLVLSFSLLFILYLAYPRPSTGSWTVATGSTGSSATSSSDDTVIVAGVATNTVSATLSAGSALLAMRGQDGSTDLSDTVVVDKGTLTKVEVPTRPLDADVASTRTEGGVAIIRHVSGGDENIAPPPPPSRGAFRLFSWLRGRRKGPSQTVAHMIEKLEKDVREGAAFEPAEMGQRLADIERLERREADGEQKRRDEVAKRALESSIKQVARDRHDVVSEKIAHVEELMTKYGAKHPELLPKLRELESHLAHPDMAHANQEKRLEQVRGMRRTIESLSVDKRENVRKEAEEIEKAVAADVEDQEVREAEAALRRAKALAAVKRRRRVIMGKRADADVQDDDDEPEVVVIHHPKRRSSLG